MLRSLPVAALMLVMSACQPSLPYTAPPNAVVTAVFDPLTSKVPLPNDLVFLNPLNSVCPPGSTPPTGSTWACAQAELLGGFAGQFPSDQTVGITIDFVQTNLGADGTTTDVAPDLDLASFTPSTFFVYGNSSAYQGEVATNPLQPADYVKFADHGTLTLHHQGLAPWAEGKYAVFVRGGPDGVKTVDGTPVYASQVFNLVAQGLNMEDPANIGLLKAQTGSTAAAIAQGRQLNLLIALYKDTAYPVADTRFPHQDLAILTTFQIAPVVTNVTIDPARSEVPLPIDLLRDPASGKLSALAACTLAGSSLAADGNCASATATAAAAGFKALDGFSTTGAILAPTSDLIRAATVTATSLLLYDLTNPATPVQVDPTSLILEPCEFTSACGLPPPPTALSPVIAIQPSGATNGDPTSVFRTKPLKDNTDYAVVMTTDILDKAGKAIGPGTVAKILRFANPVSVGGKSALQGIDDATTASLEKMRLQLKPVFAKFNDLSKVAMAYTFHTQTILSQANQLAALPYSTPAATALPIAATFVAETPTEAFAKYGATAALPSSNINEILEVDIPTFNALDPVTGAFLADPTKAVAEQIHVLIATPKTTPNFCPGSTVLKCAPMMVFRHGLGRGRADMLAIADSFAAAGMVTVAIDAAKHGDRSFCTSGTTGTTFPTGGLPIGGCNPDVMCTTTLPPGAQGDLTPPGRCADGKLFKKGVNGSAGTPDGIPVISGNYLVSANFFRTRDTMRQDLIDESQLVRALAFNPAVGGAHAVFDHMNTGNGAIVIDHKTIYFSGQSLGAIQGTMDVATNPRISKAAFNVGGGSIVDIFTNSPAFTATTDQLLAGLGIQRGTPEFLQFLVVAKTVLDPADPINFAGHLTASTLPNLLAGGVPQVPKQVLTQIAKCDGVVPNPFGLLHASNANTGPLPTSDAFFADDAAATGTFQVFVNTGFTRTLAGFKDCTTANVGHSFLLDFTSPSLTLKAQGDIASFVTTGTFPLSVETP